MARELKTQYQEFVRNTAPDMDMLWSRIEREIDKRENVTENETTYDENRKKIRTTGFNFKSITAAAAAIVVIVSAAVFLSQRNSVSTDNAALPDTVTAAAKNDGAELTQDAADNGTAMNFTNGKGDDNFDAADNGAEVAEEAEEGFEDTDYDGAEEALLPPEYAYDKAETEDDDIDKETIKTNGIGGEQSETTNALGKHDAVDYGLLALADTDTPSFIKEYAHDNNNNDGLTAGQIFAETEYFADVTVTEVRLGESSAEYSLRVGAMYSNDSDDTEPSEIELNSASPYILQENREYLLALKNVDGEWVLVCEDIPQIEITLDKELVYPYAFGGLSADEKKCSMDSTETSYPTMLFADRGALDRLLEMWRRS